MALTLTESLQHRRLIVVAADAEQRLLRVRSEADACTDLSCHDETVVVAEDGPGAGLAALNPGDIVKVTTVAGRAAEIVVVRRVWDELSSPEF
jgi:hypothetical protein